MGRIASLTFALALPLGLALADTPTRIGVIDSQRIFAEYQDAKDAEAIFQQEMQQWQKELEDQERTIVAKEEQIRSQSLLLSKEKLDELQREHETLLTAYNKAKAEILDPKTGKAVMRNQELSRPINDQISKVVEQLGAQGEFALIIDLATTNAVYLAEGIDLTDAVLAELAKGGS
jgi:Skp family chaperone for outer membrane proteins